MEIKITPMRLALVFGSMVAALVSAHVVIQNITFLTGDKLLLGLVPLFSIGSDGNLPTFYSVFAIFFCALLLTLIARASRKDCYLSIGYWCGMALVFLFLSVDMMLMLHERAIEPIR